MTIEFEAGNTLDDGTVYFDSVVVTQPDPSYDFVELFDPADELLKMSSGGEQYPLVTRKEDLRIAINSLLSADNDWARRGVVESQILSKIALDTLVEETQTQQGVIDCKQQIKNFDPELSFEFEGGRYIMNGVTIDWVSSFVEAQFIKVLSSQKYSSIPLIF